MTQYEKVNVKLSNAEFKKLKSAVKSKTVATLRMTKKVFESDVPNELLLATWQKAKLCRVN